MGTSKFNVAVTCNGLASHQGINSGLMGHLARMQTLPFPCTCTFLRSIYMNCVPVRLYTNAQMRVTASQTCSYEVRCDSCAMHAIHANIVVQLALFSYFIL